ncbi:MAG: threonine aldolase family protein [Sphingobacteriales bacterium]
MNFSSENYDKTHPEILKALIKSNTGFAASYGKDEYTVKIDKQFKEVFGTNEIDTFFCFNGTGANNFALSSITEKHSAILCADVSHLYTAESTAPETFTGCRLYPVKSENGKIDLDDFSQKINRTNGVHLPVSAVLTITQPTEYGTVYSLAELKAIAKICKSNNILLHIDGARIFNALVALNCSLKELIKISAADVLTLGGTKSGLMFGEAVLFFKSRRFKNIDYNHKRSMQLASKNRFIAAQFIELFRNELWAKIASHTNDLARYFGQSLAKINPSLIAYSIETNMVFMKMSPEIVERLKPIAGFYCWDAEKNEVRFAFSFSNTKKEVRDFLREYKKIVKKNKLEI